MVLLVCSSHGLFVLWVVEFSYRNSELVPTFLLYPTNSTPKCTEIELFYVCNLIRLDIPSLWLCLSYFCSRHSYVSLNVATLLLLFQVQWFFFICSIYSIDIVWKITTLWNEIETDQNYFSCPHCFFCANSSTVPHFWLSKE